MSSAEAGAGAGAEQERPPVEVVCVFSGSRPGADARFMPAAEALGKAMVARDMDLVYGGGTVGLMGAIARAIDAGGRRVHGVIPASLAPKEVSGEHIGEVTVCDDMHIRKCTMYEKCDAFIAMPGGFGTLEELTEVVTWQQLGIQDKPIGLLNTAGFWDPFLAFIKGTVAAGFIDEAFADQVFVVDDDPEALLQKLVNQTPPASKLKWKDEHKVKARPPREAAASAAAAGEDK